MSRYTHQFAIDRCKVSSVERVTVCDFTKMGRDDERYARGDSTVLLEVFIAFTDDERNVFIFVSDEQRHQLADCFRVGGCVEATVAGRRREATTDGVGRVRTRGVVFSDRWSEETRFRRVHASRFGVCTEHELAYAFKLGVSRASSRRARKGSFSPFFLARREHRQRSADG